MTWVHRTIIVPSFLAEAARQACSLLAGSGGTGMFPTPLSPTGTAPITHYISSGPIEADFATLLESEPQTVVDFASSMGVQLNVQEISYLLYNSDISEESATEALTRLNLQFANETDFNSL